MVATFGFYGVKINSWHDFFGHSLARSPSGMVYEINHPDFGKKDGLLSWLLGGVKSIVYEYKMNNDIEMAAFWDFGKGRDMVTWQLVYVPNTDAATSFFETPYNNGSDAWDYNFFTDNCKHYVLQGFNAGGAGLTTNTCIPREWTGTYVTPWYRNNPNNH